MSGLIILPILIAYILFAMFMYKLTASKIVLIVILVFPFWDLILKQGINFGYRVYLMSEPTTYAYPERDKDGKIESVGHPFASGGVDLEDFTDRQKVLDRLDRRFSYIRENVSDFVEFKIGLYDDNPQLTIVKFYLSDKNKNYEIIDKSEARYIENSEEKKEHLFGWFYTEKIGIYDTKEKKYLSTVTYLSMKSISFMNYIRENIFWLQSASGSGSAMFRVHIGGGFSEVENKMIKDFFTNQTTIRD